MPLTIFQAKKIITMDRDRPQATHVAVRDGRILGVGVFEDVSGWGDHQLDTTFADKVVMPGFVEGHCHLLAGGMWKYLYVGYHDRIDPGGKFWPGVTTIEDVLARMAEADKSLPAGEPLIAWAFDPIFLMERRPDKDDFDKISSDRPIVVMHSNFHVMTVNSKALELAGYDAGSNVDGIDKGADGEPNGELQEMAAMFPVMRRLGLDFRALSQSEQAVVEFGMVCNRAGVTTAGDLINDLDDEIVNNLHRITSGNNYPIRLASMLNALSQPAAETAKRAVALKQKSTDKLRLGGVKLVTDGSIQAFTARLRWPGYFNGASNGIWNIAPEQLKTFVQALIAADVAMHIHVNGDEAIDAALDAIESALAKHPRPDHRITLQHCQMADQAQFRRMKKLGACANLFSNHVFYFGDKHAEITIGPDRAERIDACASALEHGVPLAVHSDAPVTPMGPLHCAWAAVNRLTESGKVLGAHECISVDAALEAITLGPAYTLKMDSEVGSIETGKWADFVILEDDPLSCDPVKLKDIAIWGTVLGGIIHKIDR
jgi:predicted amidohydrolase YtcJ